MTRAFTPDERSVSIAVTHVLAIGITTVLISTLLLGASGLLDQQKDGAARRELQTIGNRLAAQISAANDAVESPGNTTATFEVRQPSLVADSTYSVNLEPGGACTAPDRPPGTSPDRCLVLELTRRDLAVRVPVHSESADVTLTQSGSGEFVIRAVPSPPTIVTFEVSDTSSSNPRPGNPDQTQYAIEWEVTGADSTTVTVRAAGSVEETYTGASSGLPEKHTHDYRDDDHEIELRATNDAGTVCWVFTDSPTTALVSETYSYTAGDGSSC